MTKAELEKEAEDKGVKYADSLEYTISKFSDEEGYCWSQVEQAYEKGALDFAEPREKQIDELKAQIKVLEQNLEDTEICENGLKNRIADLEAQIEQKKKEEMEEVASALAYQRTVGVDNRIAELEDKLANADFQIEGRDNEIRELKKEIENYKLSEIEAKEIMAEQEEKNKILERRIIRAKECMKKLLFIINSEPSNYNCKGLIQDADNFIHNRTCNIRKSGNHCITEEPCIMCDN